MWQGSLTVKASQPKGPRHRSKLENSAAGERERPRRRRRRVPRTYQLRLSSQTLTPQIASSPSSRLGAKSATRDSVSTGFFEAIRSKQRKGEEVGGGGGQRVQKHTMSATAYKPWNGQATISKKEKESERGRKVHARKTSDRTHGVNARNKTFKTPGSWRFRPKAS